jgi:alpha-glucosidase (family GH31 glycosyl hydrolase)
MLRTGSLLVFLVMLASSTALADGVRSGSLRVDVATAPFSLTFATQAGPLLWSATDGSPVGPAALSAGTAAGWIHATTASGLTTTAHGLSMTVHTSDPQGTFDVRIRPGGEGIIDVEATPHGFTTEIVSIGAAWAATPDERFYGLGERADAVQHRGARVESYVSDGPWINEDRGLISAILPPPGFRARDDATYFPVPWILSSRGYGLLIDNDETSYHDLATPSRPDAWSFEVIGAPEGMAPRPGPASLRFRVFAGPQPADVLRRFTAAVGRQPRPAAPWVFGPWYQGPALQAFRDADVPVSVSQTYLHYLPCGGDRSNEPARTAAAHALGYANTTYFNPMLCTSYTDVFDAAVRRDALLTRADGTPYVYQYFTSRSFDVAQFDFSVRAGDTFYASLLEDAIDDGHDGWMEDFGEYTPLDGHTADGLDGGASHNRYPTDYHCAAYAATRGRPIVRFQRSGWTGAARCAQVVWSGDPSTSWEFDGLQSVVKTGLGMGLSGVSRWGSDIGGFFSILGPRLTDELLLRWVQLGAVSGVMRTQRDGIAIPSYTRPQVEDPAQIDNWRRYTKLRTQLYPYIEAADREYRRSGLPIMRHLVLAYPGDPAADRDDEFLFGPDLLAAPVLTPGATTREAYLPAGAWIDFWRALQFDAADGGFDMQGAAVIRGGGLHTVPAPLDELPLFVRAGAIIAMLPPDVDTLADYGAGAPGLVRLADRIGVLHLLAFPRGTSEGRFGKRGRYRSVEEPGKWTLAVHTPPPGPLRGPARQCESTGVFWKPPRPALHRKSSDLPLVSPAKAGIQGAGPSPPHLDTRFRGHDGLDARGLPPQRPFCAKPPRRKLSKGPRSLVTLEASMATLESPFQPCSVLVDRRPLPSGAWTYDPLTGVLRAQIEEPHFRLEALACAP